MVSIRKVTTLWAGVAGTPYLSTMYFTHVLGNAQGCIDAVDAFWTALAGHQDSTLTYTVEAETPIIDDTTGDITSVESGTAQPGGGSVATAVSPPQIQGLINAFTDTFILGRGLRGKVYVPGIANTSMTADGAPATALLTSLQNAGDGLVTATSSPGPWRVFSRTHFQSAVVTRTSPYTKFAVLRSRRD